MPTLGIKIQHSFVVVPSRERVRGNAILSRIPGPGSSATQPGSPAFLRPLVVRGDCFRRGLVYGPRLPLAAPNPPRAGANLTPLCYRPPAFERRAIVHGPRFPLASPPPPLAGPAPLPRVVRHDYRRAGLVYRVRPPMQMVQALSANGVPKPLVVRRDYRRPALVYRVPLLPVPPSARPGWRIEFKSGHYATMPLLRFAEPAFTRDTNQVFVGNDFENVCIGGFGNVPAHSSSSGYAGEEAWDGTYLYKCIAASTWVRWGPFTTF